jgi:hypothetical protein
MNKKNLLKGVLAFFGIVFALISCDDDENSLGKLTLNLNGLEDLGSNFRYEGWIIVNGTPISTGTFTVNSTGSLSKTQFDVDKTQLINASDFVLSIEPTVDPDPAPSNTKYLAGSFSGSNASVSASIVGNFNNSTGKYVLGTPTNGNANPNAGVWFMDGAGPSVGLNLPTLDSGWRYEGWVVSNGTVLSTGTFINPNGPDMSSIYSGMMPAPPFPGEDFLVNAPAGLTFPANLSGANLVISVEPFPDNSPMPFTLKPLSHMVANPAATGTTINMVRSLTSFPSGSVSR